MVPSPPHPSSVQRESIDHVDLVNPVHIVDVPRDIIVGWKRHTWSSQNLQEAERYVTPCGTLRK
jgi:hypothetical protein